LGGELIGGEIPDTRFRIRRRARAEDPIDLAAPLGSSVEVLAAGLAAGSEEGNGRARYWSPTTPNPDADSAGDGQPGDGGGDGMH
jgi:hypothetical protein